MISVLTVNYHSGPDLRKLIDSLSCRTDGTQAELVITNNSPEERLDFPPTEKLPVTIIESANEGFAAGINRAFQVSRGEHLFIANPDVRVTPRALADGAQYLDAHPDVGLILPLLRYPGGEIQPSIRRFYTWPVVLYARSPMRNLGSPPWFFRRYLYEDADRSREMDVDWGLGAAMFLRRKDVAADAIFDDRFFLYFEDVDLCWRVWQRGQRVVYCPNIECIHDHRRASRAAVSRAGWHHFQSLLKFVAKHRGLPRR